MSHYCLPGNTSSGVPVHDGTAAWNAAPKGSRWRIVAGPEWAIGITVTVLDTSSARFGHRMDRWVPDCSEAFRLGIPWVEVEPE